MFAWMQQPNSRFPGRYFLLARYLLLVWIVACATTLGLSVSSFAEDVSTLISRAKDGDAIAQERLGWWYHTGINVDVDHKQAAHWYYLAAEQGRNDAQNNLGLLHQHGFGEVQASYKEAARYFKMAADRGHVQASFNLALLYNTGYGVKLNYTEAARLFRHAAGLGYIPAYVRTAQAYAVGQGIRRDRTEALKWAILSSNALVEEGQKLRLELEKQLSPDRIIEAERKANEFTRLTH